MSEKKQPENAYLSVVPTSLKTFIDNSFNKYGFNIEHEIEKGNIIKIRSSLNTEKFSWQFIGKKKFEATKNELNEYLKILTPDFLELNPQIKDEIIFYTNRKREIIKILHSEILNIEKNPNSFLSEYWEYHEIQHWLFVVKQIINQPLFIIEAIEKYPKSIEEPQRIYLRNKFLRSKFVWSKDKHEMYFRDIERLLNVKLAKGIDIKPLLYYFDQTIKELTVTTTCLDYINTPLFKYFFEGFLPFYERTLNEFKLIPFTNIEAAKKKINEQIEKQPPLDKIPFDEKLLSDIHEVFNNVIWYKIPLEDFLKSFRKNTGMIKPIVIRDFCYLLGQIEKLRDKKSIKNFANWVESTFDIKEYKKQKASERPQILNKLKPILKEYETQ